MEEYKDLAEFALRECQEKHPSYADVRLELNQRDTVSFINGKMHIGNLPIDLTDDAFTRRFGLNVRKIVNGGMGMGTTNHLTFKTFLLILHYPKKMKNQLPMPG